MPVIGWNLFVWLSLKYFAFIWLTKKKTNRNCFQICEARYTYMLFILTQPKLFVFFLKNQCSYEGCFKKIERLLERELLNKDESKCRKFLLTLFVNSWFSRLSPHEKRKCNLLFIITDTLRLEEKPILTASCNPYINSPPYITRPICCDTKINLSVKIMI